MNKFIKILMLFMGTILFFTLNPMSAEAEWKSDANGWWYNEGTSWCTGWKQVDKKWYYFNESGYMMTGWVESNSKWYYLNEDGSMAHDCEVQGYKLGTDGAWIQVNVKNKESNTSDKSKMVKSSFKSTDDVKMDYWLYSPKNANSNEKLPLIIYLHGYWGEDTNVDMVVENEGLPKFLYNNTIEVPAYVLCPCCEEGGWPIYMTSLKELVDDLVAKGLVDPDRVSITGHSMGGFGTWIAGAFYPDLFSCIVPISGYMEADYIEQTKLNEIPVWAVVGDKDTTVDPQFSIDSVNKLKELGGNAKVTKLKGAEHNDTAVLVYKDKDLDILNWMISQNKSKK